MTDTPGETGPNPEHGDTDDAVDPGTAQSGGVADSEEVLAGPDPDTSSDPSDERDAAGPSATG